MGYGLGATGILSGLSGLGLLGTGAAVPAGAAPATGLGVPNLAQNFANNPATLDFLFGV